MKVLDSADEISEGAVMDITAGGVALAVMKVNGEVFALEGTCPHEGGPLGKGVIEDGYLVCPWHGWEFDPSTGNDRYNPSRGVRAFDVEIRDDGVYVTSDQ
ncbi:MULTISPECIES: Rieske (2Fe-2S) protein [Prosthecochloris]|nr:MULTISPECIES: Rieske (2Fe-2S) protein [Prosthecochloris]